MYLCIRECFVNGRRYVPNNPKKNIGEFKGVDEHPCFKEVPNVPTIPVIDERMTLAELAPPLIGQKKVSPEMEEEMKNMKADGATNKEIAEKYDVSVSTVIKYTKGE